MKFEYTELKQSNGEGGGNFLKIADGKSVNAVFRGDVYKFWQIWSPGTARKVFHEPAPGSATRFRVNVIVHEDGKFVPKIWEFSPTVSNALFEISKELDLTKVKCKISRVGTGKKTQWIVIPLGPLDADTLKKIEPVELLSLEVGEEKESSAPQTIPGGVPF